MKILRFWSIAVIASLQFVAGQTIPGRYIVELSGEPAISTSTKGMHRQAAMDRRAAVRARQQEMRAAVEQQDAQVIDTVDTVANALIVNARSADALAKLPGVKRVHQVR